MPGQCTAAFDAIAGPLGDFSCRNALALIHLRNPLHLTNGTLPVLELMMVAGAIMALIHGIRRLRREGDPTNLALWFATVVYLFVIEIPLYFPNVFGIQDQLGIVFVHNVFTVDFLFDRLPLYIVALYPAVVSLAYEIVRELGVFRDRGIVVGAVCVGFVHHCLYEIFDQLGPQMHWWAWNSANPINRPMLTTVPMTSVFIFATLGPIVVTALVLRIVRGSHRAGRTVIAGMLVPIGIAVLSIPTSLFGGPHPHTGVQATIFTIELAAVALVAVPVLWHQARRIKPQPNQFVRVFGPLYLVVLAALWITAFPPTGNLTYAAVCFVPAGLGVAAVGWPRRTVDQSATTAISLPSR